MQTRVPGALPDGKILWREIGSSLRLECDKWLGERESEGTHRDDIYIVYIDGIEADYEYVVPFPVPDIIQLDLPYDSIADFIVEGEERLVYFQIAMLGTPGEYCYLHSTFAAVFDAHEPGGGELPHIEFGEDIEENGLTLSQLKDLPGGVLPASIAAYFDQKPGDVLHLLMSLRPGGPTIPCGEVTVSTTEGATSFSYTQFILEKAGGPGVCDFWYYITDASGNRSKDAPKQPVWLYVDGAPYYIPPPVIPGYFDGLITDTDARPVLEIDIPACRPPAQAGDYIIVYVDGNIVRSDRLTDADVARDPMLRIPFPYASLPLTTKYPIFKGLCGYDIVRDVAGKPLASPSLQLIADFDLTLPGGPDPDPVPLPDPDPSHPGNPNDNLLAPTLVGADGSENTLPPEETDRDANGTVPWFGEDGTEALEEGDKIQLFIDGAQVGATHVVTAAEVAAKVALLVTVLVADLLTHIGQGNFWYTVTRELTSGTETPPPSVTAESPVTLVNIQSEGDLPGGGDPMLEATFAGWVIPIIRRTYTVGPSSLVDDMTHVRIRLEQTNLSAGDTITWTFTAYKRDVDDVDQPFPAGDRTATVLIRQEDLDEWKDDGTLPHPPPAGRPTVEQRLYMDIPFTRAHLEQILLGSADFVYTITNAFGTSAESVLTHVTIDVR